MPYKTLLIQLFYRQTALCPVVFPYGSLFDFTERALL